MRIIKAVLILVLLLTTGCLKSSSTPAAGTPGVKATSVAGQATTVAAEPTQEGGVPTAAPEAVATPKPQTVKWGSYKLQITSVVVNKNFPVGCTGEAPTCTTAKTGKEIVSVTFSPLNLAEGKDLPYKKLPTGIKVTDDQKKSYSKSLQTYNAENKDLTLGFIVPEGSQSFKLTWPNNSAMKLVQ